MEQPVIKKKNRRAKKKNNGFKLVFDRQKRIEFVTGFKKRKDERREQAQELKKEEKKEARKQVVEERKRHRDMIQEQYEQIRQIKRAETGDLSADEVPIVATTNDK